VKKFFGGGVGVKKKQGKGTPGSWGLNHPTPKNKTPTHNSWLGRGGRHKGVGWLLGLGFHPKNTQPPPRPQTRKKKGTKKALKKKKNKNSLWAKKGGAFRPSKKKETKPRGDDPKNQGGGGFFKKNPSFFLGGLHPKNKKAPFSRVKNPPGYKRGQKNVEPLVVWVGGGGVVWGGNGKPQNNRELILDDHPQRKIARGGLGWQWNQERFFHLIIRKKKLTPNWWKNPNPVDKTQNPKQRKKKQKSQKPKKGRLNPLRKKRNWGVLEKKVFQTQKTGWPQGGFFFPGNPTPQRGGGGGVCLGGGKKKGGKKTTAPRFCGVKQHPHRPKKVFGWVPPWGRPKQPLVFWCGGRCCHSGGGGGNIRQRGLPQKKEKRQRKPGGVSLGGVWVVTTRQGFLFPPTTYQGKNGQKRGFSGFWV